MFELPVFLSIGVPAYNEEESIQRSLYWITKQTLWKAMPPERREIIVLANGCTDRTAEIAREMQRKNPEIKVIETPKKSKAAAWNIIVRESNPNAEILLFTDADVVLHRRALEKIWTRFKQNRELELVGGMAVPINVSASKNPQVRERNIALRESAERATNLAGCIYGIKRKTALGIKMPENLLTEDLYLRLLVPDARFAKEKSAKAFFKPPETVRDIMRQERRYRLGLKQLVQMGLLPQGESIWTKAKKLRGLPLRQKLARIYFYGIGRIKDFNPKTIFEPQWSKVKSSKIPKRQRHRKH
ncbi:MAG: glycosyltransferase family 2 protein [Candidatus Diapherotrites archaeon]